ncbi:MAG: aminotransferase class I/II-fold pyridoxal phosphate-dependent enzyme [Balneolaceae bacterium]
MMVLGSEKSAKNFTQNILEQGVILRRTQQFGLPHCIRVTIGAEEDMNHFEESFHTIKVET